MTIIVNVGWLIDGTGSPPQRNRSIIIEGKEIKDIRPTAGVDGRGVEVETYDYPQLTAMPGIIDCHDHLAHLGLDLKERFNTPPSLAVLKTGGWVTETLRGGVTTIRDAGGVDLGVKMAVEQGVIPGPRMFISLVIITQTGGHGDLTQPSGLSTDFPRLPGIPDGIADGTDSVRRKVREVLGMGADWIKVATNGGSGSPRGGYLTKEFTLEELRVIVDEAHGRGVRVMAHAHGGESLDMCLAAGVDTIEHGSFATDSQLEAMAGKGTWMVPTLSVTRRMLKRIEGDPGSVPVYTAAKLSGVLERKQTTFRRALEFGVPIAMGSDAGALGHGKNADELVYMVQAGMTPMQSIVTGTQMGARLLGISDRVGTLQPGRFADLILVDGDPTADITVVAKAECRRLVMKEGAIQLASERS